jgi:hypothetical protein
MTEYYGWNEKGQWVKVFDDGAPEASDYINHYPKGDENYSGMNWDWKNFDYDYFKAHNFPSYNLIENFPRDYWGWLLNKPIYTNQGEWKV